MVWQWTPVHVENSCSVKSWELKAKTSCLLQQHLFERISQSLWDGSTPLLIWATFPKVTTSRMSCLKLFNFVTILVQITTSITTRKVITWLRRKLEFDWRKPSCDLCLQVVQGIIHQVETKEITTVNEVLISIDFYDFTSPLTPWVLFRLRRHIKLSRQSFIGYPNTSKFVKNTPLHVVFSTLFSVFGYPDETLSLVFDILLQRLRKPVAFQTEFVIRSANNR